MKRILLAFLLLGAALRAEAVDWTDIWYNFDQQGYGYNLVQSDSFIYATFYVYDPNGAPTWYGAGLRWDDVDSYSGKVYKANGTFFGAPWNPANFVVTEAGTATFKPSAINNYEGRFSYTITNVGSVTNQPIQRQSLEPIATGGSYVGGQSGEYTGCTDTAGNYSYIDRFDLEVTHLANGSATFAFAYVGNLTCTLAGTYEQHGQYYLIPTATYVCSDGLDTTAKMSEIKATALGIEGRLFAPSVGGGCAEGASFAAVLCPADDPCGAAAATLTPTAKPAAPQTRRAARPAG